MNALAIVSLVLYTYNIHTLDGGDKMKMFVTANEKGTYDDKTLKNTTITY